MCRTNRQFQIPALECRIVTKLMMNDLLDVIMQSVKSNVYKAHDFITTIFFSDRNVYKALRET